jgi:hypothetical protein
MEAVREITEWKDVSYRQPNHIYLLDGDKVLAYIKWGEGKPEYLSGKIKIDRRGRKFEPADIKLFKQAKETANVRTVQGSKGQTYRVNDEEGTCSCPGFTFRGSCKHLGKHD